MWFQMNVGLNVKGGDNSPEALDQRAAEAKQFLPNARVKIVTSVFEDPDGEIQSERTAVLRFEESPEWGPLIAANAALQFQQDCVALWDEAANAGELIGPRAAEWGAFNPKYFQFA